MTEFEALSAAALFSVIVGLTLQCTGVLTVSNEIDKDGES